jgi:hypothetical protein
MEKNLEKRRKFTDQEEYRHHYMAIILKQVQEMIPIFVENYTKSLMKHYGIDNKYLPPNFRAPRKEAADANASGTEGSPG